MVVLKFNLILFVYFVSLFTFGLYIRLIEIKDLFQSFLESYVNPDNEVYDYIIVGAGSAGSTIALRLAEDPKCKVLVLEAGPIGDSLLDIPAIGPLLQLSAVDWKYQAVRQEHAAKALNNHVSNWPMGRVLGGSGRLNNMVYIRGHPEDYHQWFRYQSNYNYMNDVLYYFKKSEDHSGRFKKDETHHSTGGPFIVSDLLFVTKLASSFLDGVKALGFPVRDLNAEYNTGFMEAQVNTKEGSRWMPAHYLKKYINTNVTLKSNSYVTKILMKFNFEAYGVEYNFLGKTYKVKARKAVILSAGVIGTPKLLMQSGIGPKEHLNSVEIKTKVDLPVGSNLQDHITTGLDLVLVNNSLGASPISMYAPKAVFDYYFRSTGIWTVCGCEVVGSINSNCLENESQNCVNKDDQPDLGFMILPFGLASDGGSHMRKAIGVNDVTWRNYFEPLIDKNPISILPIVLHPKSRGSVRLLDNNPLTSPVINPNYLSEQHDVKILLKGIDFIKRLLKTQPMVDLGVMLNNQVFPGCEDFEFDTSEYWECYVRHLSLTTYHPVGTCKMGAKNDSTTVVDFNFKVLHTNKLFVADASVIPQSLSGNPNAAVVMLGEKAFHSIKFNDYLSKILVQNMRNGFLCFAITVRP